MTLGEAKAAARKAAFARRKAAFEAQTGAVSALLSQVLSEFADRPLAGYLPIRSEIDPRPAMAAHAGPVAVPVIKGNGRPLRFSRWSADGALVDGPFGAQVPAVDDWIVPEVLIVPLVAFDATGNRLGYGGGFYDRTLEALRAGGPALAIGFAFDAQEAETLPLEPTDQPLDMIVTESRVLRP
ncbi:5-formyltetrahydrofolate cyclo-ligase [Chachezhania sediminis]|uniref:5-formyltetrahydrofolate cyclo-ligase n=1 Tax=Chachezhania sediminis TaxID=2599291 RepID=UPI00131C8E1E|nr:5-formyltetrahydrofolate cyclo-ligase [Chachezhania sediminis]